MDEDVSRRRLDTEAVLVGYAMSRLDCAYLETRGLSSWKAAFAEAASALEQSANSFKNLRDEFDPYHANPRSGWHGRPLRSNRRKVLCDLEGISDEALAEMTDRILRRDTEAVAEAVDSLASVTNVAHNVAERLLTGRRAEDYFLQYSAPLIGVDRAEILDRRQDAAGYDFGVRHDPGWAIEVKGLKNLSGTVQFTDREWAEAAARGARYCVVVVGNLVATPVANVLWDPRAALTAQCRYQTTVSAVWRANVRLR